MFLVQQVWQQVLQVQHFHAQLQILRLHCAQVQRVEIRQHGGHRCGVDIDIQQVGKPIQALHAGAVFAVGGVGRRYEHPQHPVVRGYHGIVDEAI